VKNGPRAVLATAAGTHFVHDGFSDLIYVLLPLWASEFGLTLAQVGVIRTVYSGGMALFQVPAGLLAERVGERRLLVAGTALTAAGFVAAGLAGGFVSLVALLLAAGLGSGVQHPLSSTLVSRAYETGTRRTALGTYNFAGDLGKVAVPAVIALVSTAVGWRVATMTYGALGIVAALIILLVLGRLSAGEPVAPVSSAPSGTGWGIRDGRGFMALSAVGMIDTATRSAFLTFLPFALMAKGAEVALVGGALAVLFAGGATGKFVCGIIADRVGVIRTVLATEAATTLGILVVVAAPLPAAVAALLPLGIALNGTSSVLYATVADLVAPDRRSRAYGLYYTLTVGASALAPTLGGVAADGLGVPATLVLIAIVALVTLPLCLALRTAVTAPASA
jgi:MFS family permease